MPLLQAIVISVIIPGAMLTGIGIGVWYIIKRTPKKGLWARFAFTLSFQLPALWVGLTLYDAIAPHPNRAHLDWGRVLAAGGSAGMGGLIGLTIKHLWGKSTKSTANAQENHLQEAKGKTDAD